MGFASWHGTLQGGWAYLDLADEYVLCAGPDDESAIVIWRGEKMTVDTITEHKRISNWILSNCSVAYPGEERRALNLQERITALGILEKNPWALCGDLKEFRRILPDFHTQIVMSI